MLLALPGLAALVFRRPAAGAALILALAPLEGALTFGDQSAVKLATVFCIGVFALRVVWTGEGVRIDTTTRVLVPFVAWASLSVLWNRDQTEAVSSCVTFALQCGLYFLILNLVRSRDDLRLALWGHVVGGAVLAVLVTKVI